MKITYLGTAAAEGWPAVFCNCEACAEARRRGGREVRTRSQALIDNELLVDLPPDTYLHALRDGLDLSEPHSLLVTHSHSDHFYPQELMMRGACFAHEMSSPELNVYGSEAIPEHFAQKTRGEIDPAVAAALHFHVVRPYEPFRAGRYLVTPLPARHMKTEQALLYLIEDGEKTLFYGNDTGRLFPELVDYLRKEHKRLDLVSLDCTMGSLPDQYQGHMGVTGILKQREELTEAGLCGPETRFVATHFSHNGGLLHDELCARLGPEDFLVAYDGLTVEF